MARPLVGLDALVFGDGLVVGFVAGVNNAWRAIRAYSRDAAKAGGSDEERRLP